MSVSKDKEKVDIFYEMIGYVEENDIYYIADLWEYTEKERPDDWFPVLHSRDTYRAMKLYLESNRREARGEKKTIPPPKNSLRDLGRRRRGSL